MQQRCSISSRVSIVFSTTALFLILYQKEQPNNTLTSHYTTIPLGMLFSTSISFLLLVLSRISSCELYKLKVSKPGHSIHGTDINAFGRAFYTGLAAPATYCPGVVGSSCPNNTLNGTIFAGLIGLRVSSILTTLNCPKPLQLPWSRCAADTLYLQVMVPGGQQIYIEPTGALGFTQAHSASLPSGSYLTGWTKTNTPGGGSANKTLINWNSPDGLAREFKHDSLICSNRKA